MNVFRKVADNGVCGWGVSKLCFTVRTCVMSQKLSQLMAIIWQFWQVLAKWTIIDNSHLRSKTHSQSVCFDAWTPGPACTIIWTFYVTGLSSRWFLFAHPNGILWYTLSQACWICTSSNAEHKLCQKLQLTCWPKWDTADVCWAEHAKKENWLADQNGTLLMSAELGMQKKRIGLLSHLSKENCSHLKTSRMLCDWHQPPAKLQKKLITLLLKDPHFRLPSKPPSYSHLIKNL